MSWEPSPKAIPAVFSLALIAPVSVSYSMKAIPLRPGTRRTSLNFSKRPKIAVRASMSYSSGRFWTKRILFGGKYSSGITAATAFVDLRPAPLVVLIGLALASGATPVAAPALFILFCSSAASAAFFLSAQGFVRNF